MTVTTDVSLRRIAALSAPALVVLAAEPLYLLVDTAVVGHLGAVPLAALAVGGVLMTMGAWFGGLLAYGTTSRAARWFGAGRRDEAVTEGVQASWLALCLGLVMTAAVQVAAPSLTGLVAGGDDPQVTAAAAGWLRIASLGFPFLLLAAAGQGWLRGVQDFWRPLRYVVVANLCSAVLCPLLVYPAGLGLTGSAVANVVAQALGGLLFVRALVGERVPLRPQPALMARQLVVGRDLLLRGLAMQACFLSATAVAGRFGTATLAAHQVAMQLWLFCALALDAVALAAQALVGAALGAGDAAGARTVARRVGTVGGVGGAAAALLIGAGATVLPRLFSPDVEVHAQAMLAWPWFVAMLPLAGVVFALDGVLIGAGDVGYLRNLTIVAALGGFLPVIWISHLWQLGLSGIWAGLTLFIVVRVAAQARRMHSGRWITLGATR